MDNYSDLSNYYRNFSAQCASGDGRAPEDCRCSGNGWLLSDVDTWHKCPDHNIGQRYPEGEEDDEVFVGEATVAPAPAVVDTVDDAPF